MLPLTAALYPLPIMKLKLIKIISCLNLFLWTVFIWIDRIWNDVLREAVLRKEATYGEMFGPISYFRPKILFMAFALTVIIPILVFTIPNNSKGIKKLDNS